MKSLTVVAVVLLALISSQAQTRNRRRAPTQARPLSIQTAITKDGRTLLLKSDGTWEYASDPIVSPSPIATVAEPEVVEKPSVSPTPEPPLPKDSEIEGVWDITLIGPTGQTLPAELQVNATENKKEFRAVLDLGAKKSQITVLRIENLRFSVTFSDNSGALSMKGELDGLGIKGTVTIQGSIGTFTGSRKEVFSERNVGNGILTVQAGVVYRIGGAQPVARTTFHLLRRDLADVLTDAGLRPEKNMNILQTFAFATRYQSSNRNYAVFYQQAAAAIQSNIVATMVTDFSGVGQFPSVPAGTYYIMGYTETRRGFALWNTPVGVATGQNGIVLDQDNAAIAL
jgi:hypothetical protein